MGIFDKAKDLAAEHSDQVDQGIERAGNTVDDRTGGKYSEHVDKGQHTIGEYLAGGQEAADEQAHKGDPA